MVSRLHPGRADGAASVPSSSRASASDDLGGARRARLDHLLSVLVADRGERSHRLPTVSAPA